MRGLRLGRRASGPGAAPGPACRPPQPWAAPTHSCASLRAQKPKEPAGLIGARPGPGGRLGGAGRLTGPSTCPQRPAAELGPSLHPCATREQRQSSGRPAGGGAGGAGDVGACVRRDCRPALERASGLPPSAAARGGPALPAGLPRPSLGLIAGAADAGRPRGILISVGLAKTHWGAPQSRLILILRPPRAPHPPCWWPRAASRALQEAGAAAPRRSPSTRRRLGLQVRSSGVPGRPGAAAGAGRPRPVAPNSPPPSRLSTGPFAAPSSPGFFYPVFPVTYSYAAMPQGRQPGGEGWRARPGGGADGHAGGAKTGGPQTMDALKARLMEAAPEEVRGILLDTPVRPR